jgi:hypothetical protein
MVWSIPESMPLQGRIRWIARRAPKATARHFPRHDQSITTMWKRRKKQEGHAGVKRDRTRLNCSQPFELGGLSK